MEKKGSDLNKGQLGISSMPLDERTRFNNICAAMGTTQATGLIKLMDLYEKDPDSHSKSAPIQIPMYVQSGNHRTTTKIISFHGQIYFQNSWSPSLDLTEVTAHKLRKDFSFPIYKVHHYNYWHCLDLYYHAGQRCHLVNEQIWVSIKEEYSSLVIDEGFYEHPLEVSRCKFVFSFDDVIEHFSRYALPDELVRISQILADDIREDYQQMDKYFEPYDPNAPT